MSTSTRAQPPRAKPAEASATTRKAMPDRLPAINVGQTIGRYVVLDRLGAGSMGAVYRAYDPELQREVALKRLRPDAADDTAATRLVREARAMARLNHPHVVAVHDAVVDAAGVTVAMEYVDGGTLTHWLETPREPEMILEAVVQAGRGLAAAHQAGFVHRDFKPGNVLVTSGGRVKVTDFGLVKAGANDPISGDRDGAPNGAGDDDLTHRFAILGTPRYMAPEQASGGTADARSDQYAFCVTLYRALAGKPPFDGVGDALQAAKLRGAPPLPKSVVMQASVIKALERGLSPEPDARWPDMDRLLERLTPRDVRWGRGVAAVALVATVGLAGLAAFRPDASPCEEVGAALDEVWSDASEARLVAQFAATQAPYADPAASRIAAALDDYASQWRAQRRDACNAVYVRAEQSSADMDLRVACLAEARGRVAAAVEVLAEADASVVARADALIEDLPALDRCSNLDALARVRRIPPGLDPAEVEAIAADAAKLEALFTAGRYDEAVAFGAGAWKRSEPLDPHPVRSRIGYAYGAALSRRGGIADAEPIFTAALHGALAAGADPLAARGALEFAFALNSTAGRSREARWLAEFGAGIAARTDALPALRARAASTQALVQRGLGNWEDALRLNRDALALRRETVGDHHPSVASSRNNLGLLLYDLDRAAEGIVEHREALRIWRGRFGDDHPEVAKSRNNLAMVLERSGDLEEAETQYREALRIRSAALGPSHRLSISVRHNLGLVMLSQNKSDEALVLIEEAATQWQEALPPDHPHHAVGQNSLGQALRALGRLAEAEVAFRRAVSLGDVSYGSDHPQMCRFWNALASTLIDRGAKAEARTWVDKSLATAARAGLGDNHGSASRARELDALLRRPPANADR